MDIRPRLTHVQLAKSIIEHLRNMGRIRTAEDLINAQHFEVDQDLYIASGRFAWELFHDTEYFIDSIARPPSKPATFRIGDEPTVYFMRMEGSIVAVDQIGENGVTFRRFSWIPGTNKMGFQSSFEPQTEEIQLRLTLAGLSLGMMLSLVNSPKLVDISRGSHRQERRAAFRSIRLPVDAWHRVKWHTAAGRQPHRSSGEEAGPRKPLHYRRGHLRTAYSHYAGAFETSLTDTGWGQWIDGRWVGHPAFGVKRAVHSPTLNKQGLTEFIKRNQQREGAR